MNIKVCGITQLKQLQQLEALDIDFAGLIFYKDSPRYVGNKIPGKELKSADFDIKKVGVFVNADYDEIMKIVESYSLDLVQLHGDESPDLCNDLSDEVEVIKTFRISDETAQQIDKLIMPYDEACDYCLFDTASGDSFGGTGKQFNWNNLSKSKIEKPFFISGGISVDDADALKAFKHPDLFAVDINSKFETEPGIKDMKLILQFREALKRK
jgi:phosphoribosylanthranilate isomerase